MLKVSELYVYPIKSLAGISVASAEVTEKGFKDDRRYMLVDENNKFLTIRQFPKMTRLQPEIHEDGLRIIALDESMEDLFIPRENPSNSKKKVVIWNAQVEAISVSAEADEWFSEVLGDTIKLVFMPEDSMRPVDTDSGMKPVGKFVSFADAFPFLMLGQASMDDLNKRSSNVKKFTVHRFRPNIVFSGGTPNQEDTIGKFEINGVAFEGLEKCARCTIPNVDPETGEVDEETEPLAVLSKYRLQNRKINFGLNVVPHNTGIVRVGDEIHLSSSN